MKSKACLAFLAVAVLGSAVDALLLLPQPMPSLLPKGGGGAAPLPAGHAALRHLKTRPPVPRRATIKPSDTIKRGIVKPTRRAADGPCIAAFAGKWSHISTQGLEEYLLHGRVSFIKRKMLLAYVPAPEVRVAENTLFVSQWFPTGARTDVLRPDGSVSDETDPEGRHLVKWCEWRRGGTLAGSQRPLWKLATTRRPEDEALCDNVTERWLDESGRLLQRTTYDGASYVRTFRRAAGEEG